MSLEEIQSLGQRWLSRISAQTGDIAFITTPKTLSFESLSRTWATIPTLLRVPLVVVVLLVIVPTFTRLYTTYRYRSALRRILSSQSQTSKSTSQVTVSPPRIPYTVPFLGSAQDFLAPKPGVFWNKLFSFHPRRAGACTLRLGPRTAHILHDPAAVQALFKTKDANRLEFNIQIARTSLGIGTKDIKKYHGTNEKDQRVYSGPEETDPIHIAENLNLNTILKTEAVNELTTEYSKQFQKYVDALPQETEIDLMEWLRKDMFNASGRALLGEKVFEYYPEFTTEFWAFEFKMLDLFFGLPEFMVPAAVKARDACLKGLLKWHNGMEDERLDKVVSSTGSISWEPLYGSRANRGRQEMYNTFGLSKKAKAGFDLGFTFGLASNAIPATGWMLLHILDPNADKSVLPRVMHELYSAQNPDGTLHLPVLFALPLMNSIFNEVLRLYTDVLVSRILEKDHTFPISSLDDKKILLKKDTLAFAPSWLGQRDPGVWDGQKPSAVFYHERFLTTDPDTGKDVFTLTGTAGRFFPFGGGKSVCPGRAFAKQEIFAATAMVLLNFDIEVLGMTDAKGKLSDVVPGLRDGLGGSGVIMPAGDMRLRVKRRKV